MYFCGKCENILLHWSKGFIKRLRRNIIDYSESHISFLKFIHQVASKCITIKTSLQKVKRYGHNVSIVIFARYLYKKRREIVSTAPDEFSNIIIKSGDFS